MKTKIKKALSVILCISILFGTVAAGHTEFDFSAEASTQDSHIIPYADLVAEYGQNDENFIYIGVEYYEDDGQLTDYNVQPGETLTAKVYLKSNMYTGECYIISFFDNNVWDVKTAVPGTSSYDANGYTSVAKAASNKNHPAWINNGYSDIVTSINITNVGWIKNTCGFDAEYLAGTDLIQVSSKVDSSVGSAAYELETDEWMFTYIATVKESVAVGTEIEVTSPEVIWASFINPATNKHDTRKRAYVPCAPKTMTGITDVSYCKTMASQLDSGDLDHFIRDMEFSFTVTEYDSEKFYEPEIDDGQVVPPYSELMYEYGDGNFVYVGAEYYEEDGYLTDYKVSPGDTLTAKVYIKSNMYIGDGYVVSLYNRDYWDVKELTDNSSLDANGYTTGGTTAISNGCQPAYYDNYFTAYVTSTPLENVSWVKNYCGFDSEYISNTDYVMARTAYDSSYSYEPYDMTSDEWVYGYKIKVKDDVELGTEIKVESPDALWQSSINSLSGKHDIRKQGNIPCAAVYKEIDQIITGCKMGIMLDSGSLNYFINDLERTFVVVNENNVVPVTTTVPPTTVPVETTTSQIITPSTTSSTTSSGSDTDYVGSGINIPYDGIDSYDSLVSQYGQNGENFIYIGVEYYEADGNPTDFYIDAGDTLTAKVFLKSNMYTGECYIISFFDNSVWDVKTAVPGTSSYDANGYTSAAKAASNEKHPAWENNGYADVVTSINITNVGWIKNTCGFDAAYLTETDLIQVSSEVDSSVSSMAYELETDEWMFTYIITAKEGLADGTVLPITSPEVIWGSYINPATGKHDTRKRAYVPCAPKSMAGITSVSKCKTMASQLDAGNLNYLLREMECAFIIGKEYDEIVEGNWTYYVDDNCDVTILNLASTASGHIVIPDTLGGYPVKRIEEEALAGCISITELTIPEGIIYIGDNAFKGCTSLAKVNYNAVNCEYMGPGSSTSTTADFVFMGCDSITEINIGSGVVSIPDFAFAYCQNVESIDIPDSVVSIGTGAFSVTGLTSIELPQNLTEISPLLFAYCSSLRSVNIPENVTSIGNSAFMRCTSLDTIEIPDDVSSIEIYAFAQTAIKSIELPSSLTVIRPLVFLECADLQSLIIPQSVTAIENNAFNGCESLTEIIIPTGVLSIGGEAFTNSGFERIIYPGSTAQWNAIDKYTNSIPSDVTVICLGDFIYEIENDEVIITGNSDDLVFSENFAIPSEIEGYPVTAIGDMAFYEAGIINLYIPDTIESIGSNAFAHCSSMQTVRFSENLRSIDTYAFLKCSSLVSVEIPDSVTNLGQYAFRDCTSIETLTLSKNLTSLSSQAFNNCSSLTSVIIPDGFTRIPSGFFMNCSALGIITIPESVNTIGNNAFKNCSSLASVYYKGSKAEWDMISFGTGNEPLTNATINCLKDSFEYDVVDDEAVVTGFNAGVGFDGVLSIPSEFEGYPVTSIASSAFSNNNNIYSAVIPEGVTSIGDSAFDQCINLVSVSMPSTLTYIGGSAFNECSALMEIVIPEGITQIKTFTFYKCSSLIEVTIPESVIKIDKFAFANTVISDIYYGGSEYQWNGMGIDYSCNAPLATAFMHYGKFLAVWIVDGAETAVEYKAGDTIEIPDSPEKEGYAFAGWTPEIPEIMPSYDVIFNAVWIANPHTITWIVDGTETVVNVAFGQSVELPADPVKKGHTFVGWSSEVPATMPDENLVFNAQWEVNTYTVTWNAYGKKNVVEYEYGQHVSTPEDPTRYGFTFTGWIGEIPATMPDENLEFKADWKLNVHKITWNIDGEKVYTFAYFNQILNPSLAFATPTDPEIQYSTPGDASINYGTPSDALIPDPEKYGYTFKEWSPQIPYRMPDRELEFTATWTANPYNIYWNVDGEEFVTVQRYNETISLPEDPVKEGMGFLGWSPEIPGTMPAEELRFYAIFAPFSGTCGDDAEWSFDRATGKLTITGTGGIYHNGYYSYDGWSDALKPYVKSIEICDGITRIGYDTFREFINVTEVIIADSVVYIEENAFFDCNSLEQIKMPSGLYRIESQTFYNCSSLTEISIPANVYNIDPDAFGWCASLTEIKVDEGNGAYSSVDGVLFNKNKNVIVRYPAGKPETEYVIPDGVTEIGDFAFNSSFNLQSVVIPDGVTKIGNAGFSESSNLKIVEIPDSVNEIGGAAFSATSLESIYIPDGVKIIREDTFLGCLFESVIIPDSVTEIEDDAFFSCYNLVDITIPDTVLRMGSDVFYNTTYYNNESNWEDGMLYINNHLVDAKQGFEGTVRIKDGTLTIADRTFETSYYDESKISEVILPEGLRSIGNWAFSDQNITNVSIPDSVIIVGIYALRNDEYYNNPSNWDKYGCLYIDDVLVAYDKNYRTTDETALVIRDGTRVIADCAFDGYYDENFYVDIKIPDSVTHIGRENSYLFPSGLDNIYIGSGLEFVGQGCFSWDNYDCNIIYKGSKSDWNNIEIECNNDGLESYRIYCGVILVETDGYFTYGITPDGDAILIKYDGDEEEIVIPSEFSGYNVIAIGESAFYDNWSINKVTVPDGVTDIGNEAFRDCNNICEINIPDSVTHIGDYAFANVNDLTEITLPSGLDEISNGLFYECNSLRKVNIPETVTRIGDDAFFNCDMPYFAIPNSVTEIGKYSFKDTEIVYVEIPDSVTQIGEECFDGSPLETVYFRGTEDEWHNINIIQPNEKLNSANIIFESQIMKAGAFVYVPVSDTDAVLIGYNGTSSAVTVPSKLSGYNVVKIGTKTFADNQNLTEITVPKTVTEISDSAFFKCRNLEKANLTVGLEIIGEEAFAECEKLESIVIPEGARSIGYGAFENCLRIKTVSLPSSVTEIGESAFLSCTLLESITIPEGITEIKEGTFALCYSLKNIEIPDSVITIGEFAFAYCTGLQKIVIPESVVSIGENAFGMCSANLTEVVVDPDNDYYMSDEDGVLYNKDKTVLILYPLGNKKTSVTVPEGVKEIGESAFTGLSVVFETDPETNEIVDIEFISVSEVREIILPDSLVSVETTAFAKNSKLHHIHIPSTVSSLSSSILAICDNVYICSDKDDCYAKEYAEEEGIEFKVCQGHDYIVTLSETEMTLDNKESAVITAEVTPNYSDDIGIIWSSSDESVATIDETGYITTHSTGETVITATSVFGNVSAECLLTVNPAEFEIKWIVEGEETVEKFIEGTPITKAPPVKEGYSFVGWSPEVPEVMPAENLEFTAVFEINSYKVSWNVDGFCLDEYYAFGDVIDTDKTFSKVGYTFAGWTPEIPATMPAEDIVFTATWTANIYESVFNGNGGVWSDGTSLKKLETAYNDDIILAELPVKSGYEFVGWAVNGVNIGTSLGKMDSVDGKVFDAVWTSNKSAKYKIETYVMNTTGTYDKTTTTISAEAYEQVSVTPSVDAGFVLNSSMSVLSGSVTPDGKLTLKVYIDRFSYTLKINDGTKITTETYYYGALLAEPATPVKSGYVFTGWNPAFPTSMPANDLTVTANFRLKTQEDNVSESGIYLYITPLNNTTISYGESIKLFAYTSNLPAGYKIKWATDNNCIRLEPSSAGKSCVVTSKSTGEAVITAWVVDENGNKVADKYGDPIQDREILYSDAGLWARILHFFRNLFKINPDFIPQSIKKMF